MSKAKCILKRVLLVLLCLLLALLLAAAGVFFLYLPRYLFDREKADVNEYWPHESVVVMSSNVRCYSPTDFFKRSWWYRAKLIVGIVRDVQPDIVGFQEVTPIHYKYLTSCLVGYDSVITYRDDSPLSEGCPVFYNALRFELIDKGSFWLSETPDVMSKSWGAAFNRVCSYVVLREKETGREMAVFNTHLDHVSDKARIGGIHVILDKIKAFGDKPSVIMGDLNAGEGSETYKAAAALFDDVKYRTSDTDSGATYQNWGAKLNNENIDYFLISKTGFDVRSYKIIRNAHRDPYPSDHFPIVTKLVLTDE